jgi:hypothetical protein
VADQRITQLTELAQADVAANDVLAIVDMLALVSPKRSRQGAIPSWRKPSRCAALTSPSSIKPAPPS